MGEFGFESTADDVLADKDLSGRTALITGGYSGLGRETARAMAAKGAHVILSGRDETKLAEAAAQIAEETGAKVETLACDLASLDSVRKAAAEANERFDKIDLLINNAGVMACDQAQTADGFEMQFGTNHLGHFVLANHLVPLLEKGEDARIVNLSSRGHHIAPVDFDDPNFESRDYDKWVSYGQSKTANVLFAVGLENRLADKGIHAYSLHPGGIMTNLSRHMSQQDMADLMERIRKNAEAAGQTPEPFKTIPQGAATTCWAATADELQGAGGLYCENCHVADQDDESPSGGVRSYAIDPDNAERLWSISEEMVGETFAY
ncbi:SDR family NAD(P)-dependent oxidoreductase [Qipengyuania psychrotolerans]|uniref:SDR family NAD(P)-dependent oxidoreductase n=1 Tax=Qipengyuania psychrotolerans TaxID=2867238 RepID=A0ABX8ZEA1_9SPHN|nr:SDR family NAD(P)-dependent oxidoreductase [Qipengyuania psychrotolerans]QZD87330.1 SDR family NAD(P)-dependent oxidoreductase [Qipengyuania psychrotolerans]